MMNKPHHITAIACLCLAAVATQAAPDERASLNMRLLAAHNDARKAVRVAPLVWSDALTSDARNWAERLARTGQFEHAPQPAGKGAQGENLWMGTAGAYTPEDMIKAWIDEKQYYRRGRFPKVSTTGAWADVGHYTQMIWYNTIRIGCAVARGGGDDFLVCRYDPPGNWIGQDAEGPSLPSKQKTTNRKK
jgi:hypothetical protein